LIADFEESTVISFISQTHFFSIAKANNFKMLCEIIGFRSIVLEISGLLDVAR